MSVLNEDKLRALLESYNVQQRECGDLQVQVEQKEIEIQMKTKQIERSKRTIEGELKIELMKKRKEETKLLENLKHLEKEIRCEKSDKNESYLKIVAAEDFIRSLRDQNRDQDRCNIQDLENIAFDAFKQRSVMRDMISTAATNSGDERLGASKQSFGSTKMEEVDKEPENVPEKGLNEDKQGGGNVMTTETDD